MAGESAAGQAGWLLAGLAPGAVVAGYRVEARVGAGGMAVVFRAMDERLGRTVALKVLSPAAAGHIPAWSRPDPAAGRRAAPRSLRLPSPPPPGGSPWDP